jgi:catechol 2,3-dioxygenase
MTLPNSTLLGPVTLAVKNLELEMHFYHDVIGLSVLAQTKTKATLGWNDRPLLYLEEKADLPYADPRQAGLYHTAFLFSSGGELARTLVRAIEKASSLFQGASDHLVSQAFYLTDPEGNGIELYLDRPRSEWKTEDGVLQMGSLPIDLSEFIQLHANIQERGEVSIGHIHLRVGNIEQAKHFYVTLLGFEVIIEHPTALFVAAGGYHHHIGANTWDSLDADPRTPGLGLQEFTIHLPDQKAFAALAAHLDKNKVKYKKEESSLALFDPWLTAVRIVY